jgi:GAF domain-containing protein
MALPGVRTVTYLATAPDRSVTHRIGTSDHKRFPIGGFDPIDNGAWCQHIFWDKRPIIGNSPAEMAVYIPETSALVEMGYGATMCAPIIIAGEVRGTVNLLGDAGILTPALLASFTALLPIAALIFTFEGISKR